MSVALKFVCADCGSSVPFGDHRTAAPVSCPGCGRRSTWEDGVLRIGSGAAPQDDYPVELYAVIAEIEPRHFWFRARSRLVVSALREAIGSARGRSVLDIGCGTGFLLAAIERAGFTVAGLDMHLEGLRYARARTAGALLCDSATRVPFSAQFDAVTLCDVIEHTGDDVALLREAASALRPGGALVATVPAHQRLWSVVDEVWGHRRRYSKASLLVAMRAAGLVAPAARYFGTLLLPAQLAQRQRFTGRSGATAADRVRLSQDALRVPPEPLNSLLYLAALADLALSRLPGAIGTSLIAVGRRATAPPES